MDARSLHSGRILFARHGQSTANSLRVISNRDLPHSLTDLGREQAATLAAAVRAEGVLRIVTSPIPRAVETAEIVGRALGVAVEVADALREFDCGVMEGRSDDAAWAAHAAVIREWFELGRPDARIEGGESLTDIRARFIPFVAEVARGILADRSLPQGGAAHAVLLISHGGLLHCLLEEILEGLVPAIVQANPLGNVAVVAADVMPDAGLRLRSWPTSGG